MLRGGSGKVLFGALGASAIVGKVVLDLLVGLRVCSKAYIIFSSLSPSWCIMMPPLVYFLILSAVPPLEGRLETFQTEADFFFGRLLLGRPSP